MKEDEILCIINIQNMVHYLGLKTREQLVKDKNSNCARLNSHISNEWMQIYSLFVVLVVVAIERWALM